MRIMLTGGGTGGHTSPAVAVFQALQRRDPRLTVQWVGRAAAIEERVAKAHTIPFRSLPVSGWPRKRGPRQAWVAAQTAFAYVLARRYIQRFQPQLVFGVGGYVSVPLMLAAQHAGIPTALHEQNRRMGMANRLAAKRASRVFLSFHDTLGDFPQERASVVGNPVRNAFVNPPTKEGTRDAFDLDRRIPVVLVSGGSQGARTLNDAVAGMLPGFQPEELQLLWLAGKSDARRVHDLAHASPLTVRSFGFLEDMAAACAAADLIISRAGASSAAEIAVMGKPSILVPYPHATDNHQEQNARALEEAGAAVVLLDHECTPERLGACVRELLAAPGRMQAMGAAALQAGLPGAAETIANELVEMVVGS